MPDPRMVLATLLGAYFPHLADNRPTLDAWTVELLETGTAPDILEEAIRAVARSSRWPSLAELLEEVRYVKSARFDSAGVLALSEEREWTPEDEAIAREAMESAMAEWKARRGKDPERVGAPVRPRMETPGEEYFSPPSSPQEPAGAPDGPLTGEEPGTDAGPDGRDGPSERGEPPG